jgi:colanic acid/amylovoran biosynthesis glycosyltransferase
MANKEHYKAAIGVVLSTVPRYSETFFSNKIKGLQANGFEVVVLVDYKTSDDRDFPCQVISAPAFKANKMRVFFSILITFFKCLLIYPRQSLKHFQLDITDGKSVHQGLKRLILNQFFFSKKLDWLHFGFGMLAVGRENVAGAIGAKMAVSFRGFDLYLSPLKHKNCYNLLFRKKVRYHVLSEEMKKDLAHNNITHNHIRVITPAINTDFFRREKELFESEGVQIVTVARLHWKKGLVYTLEALSLLKKHALNFHYTIIGEGEELERLEFAVHQLNLKNQVTFAGELSQVEVKQRLELSDVYLQYSIQEGFCNAVLEAQAMGLMTIVSNAEGLSENVQNGETGWVVPKRQPQLLAEKIIEIISLTDDLKQSIRTNAIARVRKEFNLEKQQRAFVNFYQYSQDN